VTTAGPPPEPGKPPRTLLVTIRRLAAQAAWCSNYEFEDVISAVDDVDVLELSPSRWAPVRRRLSQSLAYRGVTARLNPGAARGALARDYDLLVFVGMNAWDVLFLNAVPGWRTRCRTRICYLAEFYAGQEGELGPLLRGLAGFDVVAQAFRSGTAALERATGRRCHHLPLAVDAVRFSPFPSPPARVIDVLSVGRRSEPLHQALRSLARSRGHYYVFDTIPGRHVVPARPAEHREMFASQAKRSRLFVAYPAKFGDQENRGLAEVGARYYEAAAAGAIPVGQAPTSPAFHEEFPFPDAVLEIGPDAEEGAERIGELLARPEALALMSSRNAVHALRHHDWAHRWRSLLALAGHAPRPALGARLALLESLAASAERAPG
jgi:glycosyltransferase involved in cell wall biosynthesis